MIQVDYFYNCSRDYIDHIDPVLYSEIEDTVSNLPIRETQSEINRDLFWLLTSRGWSYDARPTMVDQLPPDDLPLVAVSLEQIQNKNNSSLCRTSTTIPARWKSDFAKVFQGGLVHLEVLPNLTQLYLDGTRVTNAGLAQLGRLENLTVLSLSSTQISDAGLTHLYGLRKIEHLVLEDTLISDKGVKSLEIAFPQALIWGPHPNSRGDQR